MKGNWAELAIKHRQVVYFFAMLLLVMGIFSYDRLGRSEDPNFTVKQMVISAAWPGATAKQMELQVTDKLEKTIQTVPDVDYVTSYSRAGVCVITVTMKEAVPGTVIKNRWQEVRNLVNDAKGDLPRGQAQILCDDGHQKNIAHAVRAQQPGGHGEGRFAL